MTVRSEMRLYTNMSSSYQQVDVRANEIYLVFQTLLPTEM